MFNFEEMIKEKEAKFEEFRAQAKQYEDALAQINEEMTRMQGEYRLLMELKEKESVVSEEC